MTIKQKADNIIKEHPKANEFIKNDRKRITFFSYFSLIINSLYTIYNGILGLSNKSIWFITMFFYYALLSTMKTLVVKEGRKNNINYDKENKIMKTDGILLIIFSCIIAIMFTLSAINDNIKKYGTIIMISIAAFTFYKIIIAVINLIKANKKYSPAIITLRNINISEALVSLLSTQASMIVSFGNYDKTQSYIMGTLMVLFVCIAIATLGTCMINYEKLKTFVEDKKKEKLD